ncbi:YjdF family protein [Enteroscipio rubneri]|uniref:YjdF family protein n=1 Tax=Enteroscipio rubneri TaxID=2070686 RepID=UPI0032088D25
MSMSKLTVRFEDPFWVGIIEVESEGDYRVARHVFGAEPTTPEVLRFVCDKWRELRFTDGIQVQVEQAKRVNPKRLRRMIEKEIRSSARRGTKAQQALAEQREAAKGESEALSRARREEQRRERFAKKTEKRKQKHRGR